MVNHTGGEVVRLRSSSTDRLLPWLAAAASGALVALSGLEPTGDQTVDRILVGVGAFLLAALAQVAPRRVTGWIALLVAASSMSVVVAAVGAAVLVAAHLVPVPERLDRTANSSVAGAALVLSAWSQLGWFQGASAAIALGAGAVIYLVSVMHLAGRARVVAVLTPVAIVLPALGASIALGAGALGVADDLGEANRMTNRGLRQVADGDFEEGAIVLRDAAALFDRAHDRLATPWGAPARFVPVVAQHRRLGIELTERSRSTVSEIADQVDDLDLAAVTDGRGEIDLAALAEIEASLVELVELVDEYRSELTSVDSPWLLPPVARRVDDLDLDIADQRARADLVLDVVAAAPRLLGGDGTRRYFLAFSTPAEARGSVGLMGNWAELTVEDGRIRFSGFGRSDDLDDAAAPGERTVTGPAEWLANYGAYGFQSGPGGRVGDNPWKNITMSPQMSSTAQVIAEMYPQSGGERLDGVFLLDVDTLATLLRFTGPLEVPAADRTIGPTTAREFLLKRQYDILEKTDRVDLLEDVSRLAIDRLLGGPLPDPTRLVRALGPQVEQRRLLGWAADPDEQALFERIGLAGDLPAREAGDGLAIALNNAGGNKIDYYLRGEASYTVVHDPATGAATGEISLSMTNNAPASGEPRYVIGNLVRLPEGTSRTIVTVFTGLPVTDVVRDGEPLDATPGAEAGYFTTSFVIDLAAGESSTITLSVDGRFAVDDDYRLALTSPPTVEPFPIEATVRDADGETVLEESLEQAGTARITSGDDD